MALGHVLGPFSYFSILHAHTSWFGVIPKNHYLNKLYLIVDLFHPQGHVNSGISKGLYYIIVDNKGKDRHQKRSRLLKICPSNCHLLVLRWKKQLYIGTVSLLGFALPLSFLNVRNSRSTFLDPKETGCISNYALSWWLPYTGTPDSTTCQLNLEIIKSVYLIGLEKGRRSIHITYLSGYCLGLCKDEGHTLLLSLVGLLQHSTKVACSGCAFLSRMYSAVDKQNSHFTVYSRFTVYSLLLRPMYAGCMSLLLTGKE